MSSVSLNLARKWRSRTFREIVGQDLSVRMLQNSLYRGQFFPVYLFAGQRGCGKTSMARLFAAALNCHELSTFQKRPRDVSLPCLACASCQAMGAGRHPDFVEIDAASHTGVDHVRQIIDAASLLPVLGTKKIYLIDEAHMLSKAAFNAFLKILEEPPTSVIFILATTDVHKILETVRSRCFQLFFKPIPAGALSDHLAHICTQEAISFEAEALSLISEHAQGSARDALNILEQVRFSTDSVDRAAVMTVLGHIDDAQLVELLKVVVTKSRHEVLLYLQEIACDRYNPSIVWSRFTEVLRAAVWVSFGVQPEAFEAHVQELQTLAKQQATTNFLACLSMMYEHELQFLKTAHQYPFFEMVLLQMSVQGGLPVQPSNSGVKQSVASTAGTLKKEALKTVALTTVTQVVVTHDAIPKKQDSNTVHGLWQDVLEAIAAAQDPLLRSLFAKLEFIAFHEAQKKIEVQLPAEYSFFNEVLDGNRAVWQPIIDRVCKVPVLVVVVMASASGENIRATSNTKEAKKVFTQTESSHRGQPPLERSKESSANSSSMVSTAPAFRREKTVDVSDKEQWQKANALLEIFPGRITEKIEDQHGKAD